VVGCALDLGVIIEVGGFHFFVWRLGNHLGLRLGDGVRFIIEVWQVKEFVTRGVTIVIEVFLLFYLLFLLLFLLFFAFLILFL
jgi:hypothetical protein